MRNSKQRLNLTCSILGLVVTAISTFPSKVICQDEFDIVVIAHRNIPENEITLDELRELFLKNRNHWKSGVRAIAINARFGTRLRDEFVRKVLQMSPEEEVAYWQEQKIKTGEVTPPEFTNTQKAVFKLPGSVSYVYRSELKAGVSKILLVIPASTK